MNYLSIDCETTGVDPENCEILSIAAVLENTECKNIPVEELPHIHIIVSKDFISGEPYALNMNKDLVEIITKGVDERLVYECNVGVVFRQFLLEHNIDPLKIKVAGKNFNSFDKKFLEKLFEKTWVTKNSQFRFHHRVLDVGSVMVDFKNDDWIPNLEQCKQRAGVEGIVTHDALEDARDVIRVLRTKY